MDSKKIIEELKDEYNKPQSVSLEKNIETITKYRMSLNEEDVASLASKLNGQLERIKELNSIELKTILSSIQDNRIRYEPFIYKFSSKKINSINVIINSLYEKLAFFRTSFVKFNDSHIYRCTYVNDIKVMPIKDLSELDHDEQLAIIKDNVYSDIRKEYDVFKNSAFLYKAFKIDIDSYIGVFSLCNHHELTSCNIDIICSLFQITNSEFKFVMYNGQHANNVSNIQINKYWTSLLLPVPTKINIPGEEKNDTLSDIHLNTFSLGTTLSASVRSYAQNASLDIRSIFMAAWGLFLSQYYSMPKVLLAMTQNVDILSNKPDIIPIAVDKTSGIKNLLSRINTQITSFRSFERCNQGILDNYTPTTTQGYFSMFHQFIDFPEINELVMSDKLDDKVICIGKHGDYSDKLYINYLLYKSDITITYMYNSTYLHEANIENLNKTLITLIQGIVKNATKPTTFTPETIENKQSYNQAILAKKALILKKTSLFDCFDLNGLMALANEFPLVTYQIDDKILCEKERSEKIYIIFDGKIELNKVTSDGYEKVVQILKPGDIFGLELLLNEASFLNYSVCSENAKIIEVNEKLILTLLAKYPSIMKSIFKFQTHNLQKFQKLWLLQ